MRLWCAGSDCDETKTPSIAMKPSRQCQTHAVIARNDLKFDDPRNPAFAGLAYCDLAFFTRQLV